MNKFVEKDESMLEDLLLLNDRIDRVGAYLPAGDDLPGLKAFNMEFNIWENSPIWETGAVGNKVLEELYVETSILRRGRVVDPVEGAGYLSDKSRNAGDLLLLAEAVLGNEHFATTEEPKQFAEENFTKLFEIARRLDLSTQILKSMEDLYFSDLAEHVPLAPEDFHSPIEFLEYVEERLQKMRNEDYNGVVYTKTGKSTLETVFEDYELLLKMDRAQEKADMVCRLCNGGTPVGYKTLVLQDAVMLGRELARSARERGTWLSEVPPKRGKGAGKLTDALLLNLCGFPKGLSRWEQEVIFEAWTESFKGYWKSVKPGVSWETGGKVAVQVVTPELTEWQLLLIAQTPKV